MLVKKLCEVPDSIFDLAQYEIKAIDWNSIDDNRSKLKVFYTSKSVHLRTYNLQKGQLPPENAIDWAYIVDTAENMNETPKYPNVMNLVNWVYDTVKGIRLGRVLIANVEPYGEIKAHIDPFDYFAIHSRFHIPFKTSLDVLFHDGSKSNFEHMPYKTLCQLNNRIMHGMINYGSNNRIHLIIDIALPGGNKVF